MRCTLRIFSAMAASFFASGIYTEIYVINGGDECMRRCLLNPNCTFIAYSKKEFMCLLDSNDKEDGYKIKIMRSVFENRTFQGEMYPAKSAVKSIMDTCIMHRWKHACSGPNVFTCNHVSEEGRMTADWMCVEVKRVTVLYMCWHQGRRGHITCRAVMAWENPYPPQRKRVVMKEKEFSKTPLAKKRGRRNVITVCATPLYKTEFAIDLHKNRIVPLHFNPRFHLDAKGLQPRLSVNETIMNFKTRMGWGRDIFSKTFCFVVNRPFMLMFFKRIGKYVIKTGHCTWIFKDIFHMAPRQISVSGLQLKIKQVDVR